MAVAPVPSAVSSSNNPTSSKPNNLYKLKITLMTDNFRPRGGRWRRVIVPASCSLLELHVVIQVIFGLEDSHLHLFRSYGRRSGELEEYKILNELDELCPEVKEERLYKLSDVLSEENPLLQYEYDFGECWGHEVKFESVVEANPNLEHPSCVEGKWAGRRDDHQDEDGDGNLLPAYQGLKFGLQETQRELRKVFRGKWPLKVDNKTLPKCWLCAYYFCSACNGECCKFCLKTDIRGLAPMTNKESESSDED